MYKIAIGTFFKNFLLFAVAALLLAVFEVAGLPLNFGVTMAFYGLLAMFSHRMVLLGENYGWIGGVQHTQMPTLSFLVRYGLFLVIFTGLVIVAFVLNFPADPADERSVLTASFLSLLIAAPIFALILALFGTVLPAAATGGDTSLGRALYRGRKCLLRTLLRFALGPGLLLVATAAITLVVWPLATTPTAQFIVSGLLYFFGFLPTHFTAVLLSMAYREVEGDAIAESSGSDANLSVRF